MNIKFLSVLIPPPAIYQRRRNIVMEMVDKTLEVPKTLSYSYIRSVHEKWLKAINRTNKNLYTIVEGG